MSAAPSISPLGCPAHEPSLLSFAGFGRAHDRQEDELAVAAAVRERVSVTRFAHMIDGVALLVATRDFSCSEGPRHPRVHRDLHRRLVNVRDAFLRVENLISVSRGAPSQRKLSQSTRQDAGLLDCGCSSPTWEPQASLDHQYCRPMQHCRPMLAPWAFTGSLPTRCDKVVLLALTVVTRISFRYLNSHLEWGAATNAGEDYPQDGLLEAHGVLTRHVVIASRGRAT
ncbi:hypothetical protein FB45DRAFT_212626 [Roridomyces roridus]|uniref:Uncharacterized protein n=1 Tax=Roridomyces roridus TaxID=1738132 RepID=A0AAD7CGI4_9AGAR|nr:hypothetical protein FB45DRAFT_212626 [Roridomyces roridus]